VETQPLTGSVLVLFDFQTIVVPASLLTLPETLTDPFPELGQNKLAEFLTQANAAGATDLTWSESLADFFAGLSGRIWGSRSIHPYAMTFCLSHPFLQNLLYPTCHPLRAN
jgi:hypothetical protein